MTKRDPGERLLEAAGEVFAAEGFHGASVREITKKAGLNVAAVNYHFQSKEDLYAAVLRHAHSKAMQCPWENDPDAPAEERLRQFVRGMVRHLLDPTRPAWHSRLMAREMSAPTRMLEELIEEGFRPRKEQLRGILEDLAGDRIASAELDLIGASIIGQCVFYRQNRPVIQKLYPDILAAQDSPDTIAAHISAFSLGAIRQRLEEASSSLSHVLL